MLFNKNDKAVSPVVATLVLIVVAIIGAAAVGALLGAFSGNVGNQANAQGTSNAASNTLNVVGSTTMQPASEKLATAYEKAHQGVQINVQGGGSGAGITAVGQGVADIGSASRAIKASELNTYPDLKSFEVGACAACFIVNTASTPTVASQTADLLPAFRDNAPGAGLTGITNVYSRSDSSGTKDTVASWLGAVNTTQVPITIAGGCKKVSGSQAIEDAVGTDTAGLGYVDYGFTVGDNRVRPLNLTEQADVFGRKTIDNGGIITPYASISGAPASFNASSTSILNELSTDKTNTKVGTYYPEGLIQPLYYITNGAPNTLEQNFIDFARSPDGSTQLNGVNYFGVTQYK